MSVGVISRHCTHHGFALATWVLKPDNRSYRATTQRDAQKSRPIGRRRPAVPNQFKVTSRASELLRVGANSLRFFAASIIASRLPFSNWSLCRACTLMNAIVQLHRCTGFFDRVIVRPLGLAGDDRLVRNCVIGVAREGRRDP